MTDSDMTDTAAAQESAQRTAGSSTESPMWRRILAIVLAVLSIVAVILSLVVSWEKTTLTDEDRFVATLASLPSDDAVATALSVRIADRIVERSGVSDFVVGVLPDPLGFLATPLTSTISDTIADATYAVVVSDGFTTVWTATLRVTHKSVSAMVGGTDGVIESEGGQVTLDLDAIASLAVSRVENRGLTMPNLDIEFGEIVLYESDELASVQSAASLVHTVGWWIPLIAILLITATIWVATDRRWMAGFLGFGTVVGSLILLVVARTGRTTILGDVEDEISREAGFAVWDAVTALLLQITWAALTLGLIIGISAWVLGRSPRAERIRGWAKSTAERWSDPDGAEASPFGKFVSDWKRTIEVGVGVVASLFILVGPPPSVLTVLVAVVVAFAAIGVVEVISGPTSVTTDNRTEVDH
jgi:hypothetical protein